MLVFGYFDVFDNYFLHIFIKKQLTKQCIMDTNYEIKIDKIIYEE